MIPETAPGRPTKTKAAPKPKGPSVSIVHNKRELIAAVRALDFRTDQVIHLQRESGKVTIYRFFWSEPYQYPGTAGPAHPFAWDRSDRVRERQVGVVCKQINAIPAEYFK